MTSHRLQDEKGFVLITSLLMLVVLMIIGIAATNTTTLELQISGNDKAAKQTFYEADGGTHVGMALIENYNEDVNSITADMGAAHINDLDFFNNGPPPFASNPPIDAYIPNTAASTAVPRTDLSFAGATQINPGSAIQMVAGYEGKGKAAAAGGASRLFNIRSRHTGNINSEATVEVEFRSEF